MDGCEAKDKNECERKLKKARKTKPNAVASDIDECNPSDPIYEAGTQCPQRTAFNNPYVVHAKQ